MSDQLTPLPSYLRAAKRKHADPDAILETAWADDLDAKQLAHLVSTLRDRHSEWSLAKSRRDPLISALLAEGVKPTRIADRLGCHARTVARVERDAEAAQPTPLDRLDKRRERDKNEARVSLPVLSFSAAGTPYSEHCRIRELLGC